MKNNSSWGLAAPQYFILLAVFFPLFSQARWLTEKEADISIESEVTSIRVAADGQTEHQTTVQIRILNETGRDRFGTMKFTYSPKSEEFKILRAETRNKDEVRTVNAEDIVDTPVEAMENGFDQTRQVLIPFHDVQIGSLLQYSYKSRLFRPPLENHYTSRMNLGQDLQRHLDLKIESKKNLFFEVNDPTESLVISEHREGQNYIYQFRLSKPVFQQVTGEVRAILPDSTLTWINVSSSRDTQALFAKLADRYNNLLQEKLPPVFQGIVLKAREFSDLTERLNFVLSQVSEKIRYMGDWRAVDGGFIPRNFKTMASTRYGDCKDLSLLTAKVLRELGEEAHVALVSRGGPPPTMTKIPTFAFNHAIVFVRHRDRSYWLDPTNFQSFAQGVPEDIALRPSLVLTSPQIEMRRTELTAPEENRETTFYKMRFLREDRRFDEIEYRSEGSFAFKIAGNELKFSRERIQEDTIYALVDQADVLHYSFTLMDLKERIVRPQRMKFTIDRKYRAAQTSVGPGFIIYPSPIAADFNKIDLSTRASYFYLGPPSVSQSTGTVENFKIKGNRVQNCKVESPWLEHSNIVQVNSNPVRIETSLKIKKYWITTEEMKTAEFKKLLLDLEKCNSERYLIYTLPQKPK